MKRSLLSVCAVAVAFSASANDLKQLPVTITRDTATWTLDSGTVAVAEPVSGGRVTGLVFTFIVPVLLQFDGDKQGSFMFVVKDDEQTITRDVPLKPRDVILGPDHSPLANIKKE